VLLRLRSVAFRTARAGVEVHTQNVDVKTNGSGTTVRAPGADVHVEKQPPAETLPESNR
jgi:hypothetical protein